jgi:hypothetical protein
MESIKNVDIRHIKLTNGENIICYVQSCTEKAFIVERPAAVQVSPVGLWTFTDWFPFSDKKVYKIMKHFVINHTEVVNETKESYIKYSLQGEARKDTIYDTDYNDLVGDELDTSMDIDSYDLDAKSKTIH